MGRIRILSRHVVNKIAAGEVIERPASVVKELMENALDAGAASIDVLVEEGGRRRIRVADDGEGIALSDLPLAFAPHATSKLSDPEELFHIATMGFRGEALASIASVATVVIRSRARDADTGHEITARCGEIGEPRAAAARQGTVVEVRDLFQNVPVRRRFLRAPGVELGHVAEAVTRIALATPRTAFRLRHAERTILDLEGDEDRRGRVERLFGGDLARELLPVAREGEGFRIEGLAAPPHLDRPRQDRIYVFLNGRYVRDRTLGHAIHEAYRGLLMTRRHPTVFLALTVDPCDVDVNVHPTKIEVRLRDSGRLHRAVQSCLREALLRASPSPHAGTPGEPTAARDARAATMPSGGSPPAPAGGRATVQEEIAGFLRRFGGKKGREAGSGTLPAPAIDAPPRRREHPAARTSPGDRGEPYQILGSYILRRNEDGFSLTDQHALHERILYHRMCERVEAGGVPKQRLLLPEVVEMSASEAQRLLARAEDLARMGFEIARMGERSVAIHAVPEILRRLAAQDWIRQLLLVLEDGEDRGGEKDFRDAVLETAACKAAVKAGDPLNGEEMADLLRQAEGLPSALSCPHGRPTTVRVTRADLERWFRRK